MKTTVSLLGFSLLSLLTGVAAAQTTTEASIDVGWERQYALESCTGDITTDGNEVCVTQAAQVMCKSAYGTYYNGLEIRWDYRVRTIPGAGFVRIGASTHAYQGLWGVKSNGSLWEEVGGAWNLRVASGVADVTVTKSGIVWIARTDGVLAFSESGDAFTSIPSSGFVRVFADGDRAVYGVGWAGTLSRYDLATQTFSPVPVNGPVYDIAKSRAGLTWYTTTDGRIYQSATGTAPWTLVQGYGQAIAVDQEGEAITTNPSHRVHRSKPMAVMTTLAASGVNDIAAGSDGRVWLTGDDGSLWSSVDGGVSFIQLATSGYARIASDGTGLYAVRTDGRLEAPRAFPLLPTAAIRDVGVSNGRMYIVDSNGRAHWEVTSNNGGIIVASWKALGTYSFRRISGSGSSVCAVSTGGTVYTLDMYFYTSQPNDMWRTTLQTGDDCSFGPEGRLWIVALDGTLTFSQPDYVTQSNRNKTYWPTIGREGVRMTGGRRYYLPGSFENIAFSSGTLYLTGRSGTAHTLGL